MDIYSKKRILVTGGTGSLGQHVIYNLLQKKIKEIRIVSRDEQKQVSMKQKFKDKRLSFIIADVRDRRRSKQIVHNMDYVIHTSAMKHVPVCEKEVYEAIQTNILGTQNIIESALFHKVQRFLFVSTDKSASPSNVYGYTKVLGERLTTSAQNNPGNKYTIFSCVRFGNMIGSAGSVVEIFTNQILADKPLTLTDPSMARFNLTLRDASNCVLYALENAKGGEVFIPKMKVTMLGDFVEALAQVLQKDVKIDIIGKRPGEKDFEDIISKEEALRTVLEDNYYILYPSLPITKTCINEPINTQNTPKYTINDIKQLFIRMEKENIEIEKGGK